MGVCVGGSLVQQSLPSAQSMPGPGRHEQERQPRSQGK